jgi:hypothetical protein
MTPVRNPMDGHAAKIKSADPPLTTEEPKRRDWLRLILAHLKLAFLCPAVANILYMVLSPERNSLLHPRGLVVLLVTIACSYLFFGMIAIVSVVAISPILWAISKLPGAIGPLAALLFGGAAGWLITQVSVNDLIAFQISFSLTAAFTAALLERAWRRSA